MTNATIVSISKASGANAAGSITLAAAVALSAGCVVDLPTARQQRELGATIENATAVVFVEKSPLASSGQVPETKDRLGIAMDGGTGEKAHEVIYVIDRQKDGGLAHFEVFVKAVR